MPAIPEFLLRKLFVPGSLKAVETGFSFELNNTFAPVTLLGFAISADGAPCPLECITISVPGRSSISGSEVTPQNPIMLPVNVVVSITVPYGVPKKSLGVKAHTREAGLLQFNISFSGTKNRAPAAGDLLRRVFMPMQMAYRARRVKRDPRHPRLHFTPPANWMNDPNGLIYYEGNYHLFYQYNPYEPSWGNIHWGHAVSKNILHWRHLPLALAPDPHGADAGGCFSGSAVATGEGVALLYTAVYPETQCLAFSDSTHLIHWTKHLQPVIPGPPAGLRLEGFRDPFVWREGNEWRMLVGAGLEDAVGCVLLYRSDDLLQWEYVGILFQGDAQASQPLDTGTMWECPSFFQLGDKWVLIVSACSSQGPIHSCYFVGQYVDGCFIPDYPARLLDHGTGACFYAPQTFLDENGERVILGWLREARSPDEQARAGWSGAMSFPRNLSLTPRGELKSSPMNSLQSLRREHLCLQGSSRIVAMARDSGIELLLRLPPSSAGWSGVTIRSAPSRECVQIGYDWQKEQVLVDCRQAGGFISEVPYKNPVDSELQMHIYMDGSVLELFIDDQLPVSTRFYFQQCDSIGFQLAGGASADFWQLDK